MDKRMIKVAGTQMDLQGEENKIELITEAKTYEKNNALYIVYEETEISGMEGSTTTLKIEANERITMKRYGSADSQIVFEEGKRYSGIYKTPYGDFKMEIKTTQLHMDIQQGNKKGTIEISYQMLIAGLAETYNTLVVSLL